MLGFGRWGTAIGDVQLVVLDVVAHSAWQLDVWGVRGLHPQGYPRAGMLPFLLLL